MTCSVCKQCSSSWTEYLMLRHFCARLGFSPTCLGVSFGRSLEAVSILIRHLLTLPEKEIVTPGELIAVMSASEELPVEMVRDNVVRQGTGEPEFMPLNRKAPRVIVREYEKDVYPWLQGKSVLFSGVSSRILGMTRIIPPGSSTSPSGVDCVFASTISVWQHQLSAGVVYVPIRPDTVSAAFPDWTHTGRKVRNFYEYVRQTQMEMLVVPSVGSPHVRYGQSLKPPIRLFPFMDSTLLHNCITEGDPEPPYQLCEVERVGQFALLRPVTVRFSKWRAMLWVGKKGYGSYLTSPSYNLGLGCVLYAGFAAPWDMTRDEILQIESRVRGEDQRVLRQLYKSRIKSFPVLQRFIKVKGSSTIPQMIEGQDEFQLEYLEERKVKIIRNIHAHPEFSENPYVQSIYAKLRLEKDRDKAFVNYKRYVGDLAEKGFYS